MSKILIGAASAALLSACSTLPSGPKIDRSYSSVAQDSRALFLILHYTALDWEKSLKVLSTGGQVSAHYLLRDEPAISYQLVDENRRSWHAGQSFWAGNQNLNAASIGIEIVNAGYTDGPLGRVYAPYPEAQVQELILLIKDIVARHQIRPDRIIGHADIAPGRKQDPGPLFPWRRLAEAGIIPWPAPAQVTAKLPLYEALPPDAAWFQDKLARVGYQVPRNGEMDTQTKSVIATFQMKYRPSDYSGNADAETAALLDVVTTPGGMLLAVPNAAPTPYVSRW
ncbi:N-acetylmuramoyl-L-alanine amidase [Paucibacter oligotrophus]|uniref:N-acetylmuramoyl-L-alanine amidase n=1 Tax=Roseateles oligotrophus TaxID=1769250 RepID=A0ABT2YD85_9BURK|nr:N-acetylmuramoyl-L-alanine amidase [Roseateles oligotrophus]